MTAKPDHHLPPLPAYVEDDGTVFCEGRTANSIAELSRQMSAEGFPTTLPLVLRRRNQELVRIVKSIGAEAGG